MAIKQLLKSNEDFVQFLRQCLQQGSGDLNEFLSLPAKHLLAMHALVADVMRNTPRSHEDTLHLTRAKAQLGELQQHISDQVGKFDQLAKMGYYEMHVEGLEGFKLSQPGRGFVREAPLLLGLPKRTLMRKNKSPSLKPVCALLFTDVLLLAEDVALKDGDRSLKLLERPLVLADVKVQDGPELDLFVSMQHSHYILRCPDAREKQRWARLLSSPQPAPSLGTLMNGHAKPGFANTVGRGEQYLLPREVTLVPGGGGDGSASGYGFTLRSDAVGFFGTVASDGAAAAAKVSVLDQILAVNGISVDGLTLEGLQELLFTTPPPLRLLLVKALHRTNVIRDEFGGVGLLLRGTNPVFIRKIVPGGPADKAGLKLGDQLWEVNSTWVRHASQEAVVRAMEAVRTKNVDMLVRSTLRRVVVHKGVTGYGFDVAQTSDTSPIVVQSVRKEGPAHQAGLRMGDQIWDVNGVRVRRESMQRVQQLISRVKGDLTLVVISTLRTIELTCTPGVAFGFDLHGNCPVTIASVDPGGQAAGAGLRAGDAIWAVNDVETILSRHAHVVDLIRQRPDRVRLSVCLS